MEVRNPVVAGAFYPSGPRELKEMIKGFIDETEVEIKKIIGIVSPHAGYIYCGKTMAHVYKTISNDFETVIVLGPNHSGYGSGVATSLENWKTPLGNIKVDEEFVKEIIENSIITEDPKAHWREHSIEVQLPWLQYIFKDFKIIPISMNPIYFDLETCKEIGEKISLVAKKLNRRVLVVASSDFTHYGRMYNYLPFTGTIDKILKNIEEMDMEVIDSIVKLKAENVIKTCKEENLTICGYGCIASMIFAAKSLGANRGKLMDYSTSFDVSKNKDAIVGYGGITIY